MASLGQSASALGRQFQNLAPFAKPARPALIALGNSSQQSQPALVATEPLARQLKSLGTQAVPPSASLDKLTASLDRHGRDRAADGAAVLRERQPPTASTASATMSATEPLVGSCTDVRHQARPGMLGELRRARERGRGERGAA